MPNVNVLSGDYLTSGSYFEVLGTGVIPNLITSTSIITPNNLSYSPVNAIALVPGSAVTFTQTNQSPALSIYTLPNTSPTAQIARDMAGYLFNPWSQGEWFYTNPADLLWNDQGWTDIERAEYRDYSEWLSLVDYNAPEDELLNKIINTQWILKAVSSNKYFKVKFNNWSTNTDYNTYPGWQAVFTPLSFAYTTTGVAINLSFSPSDLNNHLNKQYWTLYTGSNSTGPFTKFAGNNAEQYQSTGIIISSGSWLPNKIPGTNFFAKALIRPLDVERRFNFNTDSGSFALKNNEKIGIGLLSKDALEKLHINGGLFVRDNLKVSGTAILGNVALGINNVIGPNGSTVTSILGGQSGTIDSSFSVLAGGLRNQLYGKANNIGGGVDNLVSGYNLLISNGIKNLNFGSGNSLLGSTASVIGLAYSPDPNLAGSGLIWEQYLSKNAYNTIAGGLLTSIRKGISNFSAAGTRVFSEGYFNNIINGADNRIFSASTMSNSILGGGMNVISRTNLQWNYNTNQFEEYVSESQPSDLPEMGDIEIKNMIPKDVMFLIDPGAGNSEYTSNNTILGGSLNRITNSRFTTFSYGSHNQIAYSQFVDLGGNSNRVYGKGWENYYSRNNYYYGINSSRDIFIRGHRNRVGGQDDRTSTAFPGGSYGQFGASGVVIFGNDVETENDSVAVFTDSRTPFLTKKSNTFHIGHLNGISLGGLGVQISNDSSYANDLIAWMNSYQGTGANVYNPYYGDSYQPGTWMDINYLETGSMLNPISRRPYNDVLRKIMPYLTSSSQKRPNYDGSPYAANAYPNYWPEYDIEYLDLSGNYIKEFRWELSRNLGVNIGSLNAVFPGIVTAAWPANTDINADYGTPRVDTYEDGSIPILTGVATFEPANNIAIGYRNYALYSDIVIGNSNERYFQKVSKYYDPNQHQRLPWNKKHTYSRSYTPSPDEGYTTIIGGYNAISGGNTNVIGYSNSIPLSRGLTNLIGSNNTIYPVYMFYPWFRTITDPLGFTRPVVGGWNKNFYGGYNFEGMVGNSNILGNNNNYKTRLNAANTITVLGNYNLGDDVTRTTVIGGSNYTTGLGTKIVGYHNIVMSRESHILGDENYITDGTKSLIIGSENVVTNVVLNQVNIYNPNASLDTQFYSYDVVNPAPGLPYNYNPINPNDMAIIGRANTISELQRTTILGTHNLIEGGKADGEGEGNQIIGHNNYSDAKLYVQDYSVLGNFNTWDGRGTNLVGSYNYIENSIDTNILGNNNYQSSGAKNGIIIGNDHYIETSNGAAIGTNVYEYNPGQISFSPMNHLKYSNTIGAGQYTSSNYNLYGTAKAGAAQKTILTWHGIVTGSATQEIYLDERAYSPNISSTELAASRAKIPNNRMWNGKLYISIANRGLSYVRNITRGFYIVNQNGTVNASSLSTYGTVEDQVTVGSTHGAHSSIAYFNAVGDRLVLNTVGIANQKLVYHVVAEFLDTYVPTTSEDIFGYRLAADGVTKLPVLT